MALGTFAPGPYSASYTAPLGVPGNHVLAELGLTEGPMILQRTGKAVPVRADKFGDTIIDDIERGAEVYLRLIFKEWTQAVQNALWPFGGNSTPDFGVLGHPGRLLSDLAGELVLTALTGTPAATNGPATITFGLAIISPDHNAEIPMGTVERNIPAVFRIYPVYEAGPPIEYRYFSTT